ncbi:hypothetical protein L208DRAFT_1401960 [Tricholoma matsutake]|nr:hypothetical protein L208DRAFT_1401960 [Tricholoma matsutake 945]
MLVEIERCCYSSEGKAEDVVGGCCRRGFVGGVDMLCEQLKRPSSSNWRLEEKARKRLARINERCDDEYRVSIKSSVMQESNWTNFSFKNVRRTFKDFLLPAACCPTSCSVLTHPLPSFFCAARTLVAVPLDFLCNAKVHRNFTTFGPPVLMKGDRKNKRRR